LAARTFFGENETIRALIGMIVGEKKGMTRIFREDGRSVPVTVVEASANRVTQIKTFETDGYSAVQVTRGSGNGKALNKAMTGHLGKANAGMGDGLWEFRLDQDTEVHCGSLLEVSQFVEGQKVDVQGTSKGKGFAGTIKRWNFRGQDNTHGNSISHRAPGSIGQCQTPGRVFKGKKMSGHLGSAQVTVPGVEIVAVDGENNLLLLKGSIPGPNGGTVKIKATSNSSLPISEGDPS
jgi:large subunit ribosomal protein L3